MTVINPNGMVEWLNDRRRRPVGPDRYGRRKDGGPADAASLKIASRQDRRRQPRDSTDPWRGRLFDMTA